eukprot:2860931-Prymnesium_polylepis.1
MRHGATRRAEPGGRSVAPPSARADVSHAGRARECAGGRRSEQAPAVHLLAAFAAQLELLEPIVQFCGGARPSQALRLRGLGRLAPRLPALLRAGRPAAPNARELVDRPLQRRRLRVHLLRERRECRR